jgi:hypothetical protein
MLYLAVAFLWANSALQGQDAVIQITVQVYNSASLPEIKISQALAEAAWILRRGGIGVEWIRCTGPEDCQESPDPRLLVFRLNPDSPSDVGERALGFSLPFTARANHGAVFASRIARFSKEHLSGASEEPFILGAVIVHEIGHLLLRSDEHGGGIMRANWEKDAAVAIAQRRLLFTPLQALAIRRGLQTRLQSFHKHQPQLQSASVK